MINFKIFIKLNSKLYRKSSLIGKWKFLTEGYKNDFSHIDILTPRRSFQKFWPTKQTIHFKSPESPFTLRWEFFMSSKDHRTSKKGKNHYIISPAGVYVWLERGHSSGRPHAHEESLLRCHFPQQPRHPVRLPRHERQPAVALQKGMTETKRRSDSEPSAWLCVMFVWWALFLWAFLFSFYSTKQQNCKCNCFRMNDFKNA